jgi:hypothetical protein
MKGQGLNDLPRCELERRSSHHKGIFFEVPGSFMHYGTPMPLSGTRDAAPVGAEVGGIGERSLGYAENSKTMYAPLQGKVAGTDPQRADGATRSVLWMWDAECETQIVEENGFKYLLMWTPLQPGAGNPEGATTADPIRKSASTMNDPEQTFADPVGPRATTSDDARRIANTFARLRSHNEKPTPQAKRALTNIRKNADALESINAANVAFWSGKK